MSSENINIDIMNVCRLCLSSEELISIFDNREKVPGNITDIIKISTGVIITPTDRVSQKLCNRCLHITIKMFKFRSGSIVNDMQLKAEAEKKSQRALHRSVENIMKKYPRIILPSSITKTNMSPVVSISKLKGINLKAKAKRVKKSDKKIKTTTQLSRESTSQSDVVKDLENRKLPCSIPNEEMLSLSHTEPTENVLPSLKSNLPKLPLKIVVPQKLSEKKPNVDKRLLEPIECAMIQDNNPDYKTEKRLSDEQHSVNMKKFGPEKIQDNNPDDKTKITLSDEQHTGNTNKIGSVIIQDNNADNKTKRRLSDEQHSNNTKKFESERIQDNNPDNKTKRRFSNEQHSANSKKLKSSADVENTDDAVDSLVTLKYVTKRILVCDICYGIVNTAKDLRKHKMNHMKCNLCKKTFRSLEETKKHNDSECSIKKIMNNLPTIILERCDKSNELRKRFPFIDDLNVSSDSSSLVEDLQDRSEDHTNDFPEEAKDVIEHVPVSVGVGSAFTHITEISLISDDEDESCNGIKCDNISLENKVADLITHSTTNESGSSTNGPKLLETASCSNESNATVTDMTNDTWLTINSSSEKNKPVTLSTNASRSTIKSSNGKNINKPQMPNNPSVRPNINIVGENVLDVNLDDDEVNILKYILKKSKNGLKDSCAQTDLPCSENIHYLSQKNKLFYLKNLNKFLTFSKIPVNLSFSQKTSMKFTLEPSPLLKKSGHWSKHVIKTPLPPEILPVNDVSSKNPVDSNNTYQIKNTISPPLVSTISSTLPSNSVEQSNVGNIQRQSNSVFTTFLVPAILSTTTTTYPPINNTFGIVGCPVLSPQSVTNPSSTYQTDVNKSCPNSILTNPKLHGVQNNSASDIGWKNVSEGQSKNSDIQTRQITHTSSNGYSLQKSSINNTNGIHQTSQNVLIQPLPKTLFIIGPSTMKSNILHSALTQTKKDATPSTVTNHSTTNSSSNVVPAIRVKDLSELT